MAMLHGKGGSITWGGSYPEHAGISSWTVDATCDMADITNMGSLNDWKEYLAGFKGWTASVEIVYNSESLATTLSTDLAGASAALALLTGGGTLSGNAFLTGCSVSTPATDKVMLTLNFQGTGALSFA